MTDQTQDLNETIDQFLVDHTDDVISVNRVINPLLQIWQLANDTDRSAAIPVERLLTALTGRKLTTPAELTETLNEAKAAADLLVTV